MKRKGYLQQVLNLLFSGQIVLLTASLNLVSAASSKLALAATAGASRPEP